MARGTALAITNNRIAFARIDGSAKKPKLSFLKFQPLESTWKSLDHEEQQRKLTVFLKESKLDATYAVTEVPQESVLIRRLTMPFTETEKIRKTYVFQVEETLAGQSVSDLVFGFKKVEDDGARSKVLVFAAHKDAVKRRLELFDACNLNPDIIDCGLSGIINLIEMHEKGTEGVRLWIDADRERTVLVLVKDGTPIYVRVARFGLGDMGPEEVEALLKTVSAAAESSKDGEAGSDEEWDAIHSEAEKILEKYDNDDAGNGETRRTALTWADDLAREVRRTLTAAFIMEQPSAVTVSGVGVRVPGVVDLVGRVLGVEAKKADYGSFMKVQLGKNADPDVVFGNEDAIGLAMKQLGQDCLGLNFRAGEFRLREGFESMQVPLGICVTLLMILFGLMAYFFDGVVRQFEQAKVDTVDDAKEVFADTYVGEDEPDSVTKIDRRMKEHVEQYSDIGDDKVPQPIDTFAVWLDVSHAIAKSSPSAVFSVSSIDIKDQKLQMTGYCANFREIQGISQAIKAENPELYASMEQPDVRARPVQVRNRLGQMVEAERYEYTLKCDFPRER